MTPRRYVVLRRSEQPGLVSRGATRSSSSEGPRLRVDVVDPADAHRVSREADFVSAAPSMSIRLIQPMSRSEAALPAALPDEDPTSWGIRAVGADSSPFTGSGTVIAVLDTGIDRTHPAFAGLDLDEKDFTGEGTEDRDGHGTHCAGTIFGRDVEGRRIGVARGVEKALIGKVIGRNSGDTENIVTAVQWAMDNRANVISMSLGLDFPGYQAALQQDGMKPEVATSMALEAYRANIQLFDRLAALVSSLSQFRQPCLLIGATGNESGRKQPNPWEITASPPAAAEGFIAVGALEEGTSGFEVADFSNTGAAVAAPGVKIVSARNGGGFVSFDGTSMAAPHVAGVAALWAEKLRASGSFDNKSFFANVLASATKKWLNPAAQPRAIGAGIVRAPQP